MAITFHAVIGGVDYGPTGENRLIDIELEPGGPNTIGTATVRLLAEGGGGYTITDKMEVQIYEKNGANVTWRWFGGFVSGRGTGRIIGTSVKEYIVQCQDYNLLLDTLVGGAADADSIFISGLADFDNQVTQMWAALVTGAAQAIDYVSGVANLVTTPTMTTQTFKGMTAREMMQVLCDAAQTLDDALRPRFALGTAPDTGDPSFLGPYLQVWDGALAPSPVYHYTDDTGLIGTGIYRAIYPPFVRDLDGTRLANKRQIIWGEDGDVLTALDSASQAIYDCPYSADGYWWDAPIEDTQSDSAAAAQAAIDRSIAATAYPREVITFPVNERLHAGDVVTLDWSLDGILDEDKRVVGVNIAFPLKNNPSYTRMTLTLNARALEYYEDGTVGEQPPTEGDVARPNAPTSFAVDDGVYDYTTGMARHGATWTASNSTDVAGYWLYRAQGSVNYAPVWIPGRLTVSTTVVLFPQEPYSIYLKAVDGHGNQSVSSNVETGMAAEPGPSPTPYNPSFEFVSPVDATQAEGWLKTVAGGGAVALSTAQHYTGARSIGLNSTSGTGGTSASIKGRYIRAYAGLAHTFSIYAKGGFAMATALTVKAHWYDADLAFISTTTLASNAAVTTSWVRKEYPFILAPADTYAVKIEGANLTAGSAGILFLDDVGVVYGLPPAPTDLIFTDEGIYQGETWLQFSFTHSTYEPRAGYEFQFYPSPLPGIPLSPIIFLEPDQNGGVIWGNALGIEYHYRVRTLSEDRTAGPWLTPAVAHTIETWLPPRPDPRFDNRHPDQDLAGWVTTAAHTSVTEPVLTDTDAWGGEWVLELVTTAAGGSLAERASPWQPAEPGEIYIGGSANKLTAGANVGDVAGHFIDWGDAAKAVLSSSTVYNGVASVAWPAEGELVEEKVTAPASTKYVRHRLRVGEVSHTVLFSSVKLERVITNPAKVLLLTSPTKTREIIGEDGVTRGMEYVQGFSPYDVHYEGVQDPGDLVESGVFIRSYTNDFLSLSGGNATLSTSGFLDLIGAPIFANGVDVSTLGVDATTTTKGIVELATDGEVAALLVPQANDSRLSNARTPTAHASTHLSGGSDPLAAATTSARGTVELATDGENAASVVVQGNDARLNTSSSANARVAVRVNSGGTPSVRRRINIIGTSPIAAAQADDALNEEVDVTLTHAVSGVTAAAYLMPNLTFDDKGHATVATSRAGTSFPGSPSTNDFYYRTDLGVLCRYDGTRWLGPRVSQSLADSFNAGGNEATYTGTTLIGRWSALSPHPYWIEGVTWAYYVATTNSASHYWTFRMGVENTGGGGSAESDINSSAEAFDTRVAREGTAFTNNPFDFSSTNSFDVFLEVRKDTGSPGTLHLYGANLIMRRIYA